MRDETETRGTFTLIAAFIAGIALLFVFVGRYDGAIIAAFFAIVLFKLARKL